MSFFIILMLCENMTAFQKVFFFFFLTANLTHTQFSSNIWMRKWRMFSKVKVSTRQRSLGGELYTQASPWDHSSPIVRRCYQLTGSECRSTPLQLIWLHVNFCPASRIIVPDPWIVSANAEPCRLLHGEITYSVTKGQDANILRELGYRGQKIWYATHLYRNCKQSEMIVAVHLGSTLQGICMAQEYCPTEPIQRLCEFGLSTDLN
jgi:hypothetical protein